MSTGKRQKRKDTGPELALRSALYDLGLRHYVVHRTIYLPPSAGKAQRTTPDVLFRAEKVAVFVDGCYWHGCLACSRGGATPEWRRKAARARSRDKRHSRTLEVLGYRVVRIWEHESSSDAALCIKALIDTETPPGIYGIGP